MAKRKIVTKDQSKNGVRVIVHVWPDGGRTVDASRQCFGMVFRTHSDIHCPNIGARDGKA